MEMHGGLSEWVSKLEEIVEGSERRDGNSDCSRSDSCLIGVVSPVNFVFSDEEDVNDDETNECEADKGIAATPTSANTALHSNIPDELSTDSGITPIGAPNEIPILEEKPTECDVLSGVDSSHDDNMNALKNTTPNDLLPSFLSNQDSKNLSMFDIANGGGSLRTEDYLHISDHFRVTGPSSALEPKLSSIPTLGGVVDPEEEPVLKFEKVPSSKAVHIVYEDGIVERRIQEDRMDCCLNEKGETTTNGGESEALSLSFPVHRAVFSGMGAQVLGTKLMNPKWREAINDVDEKGNTPILLAIKLRLFDVAEILLCHGAKLHMNDLKLPHESVDCKFGLLDEVILSGNEDFLKEAYLHLQLQQWNRWKVKASQLTHRLAELPDFYMEMHWGFSSRNILLPLVKAVAPSDTYRIWKRGTQLRIDCSIKGYTNKMFVERGNVSIIFTGDKKSESEEGGCAACYYPNELLKYDHDKKKVYGVLRKMQQPTVGELKKICKGLINRTGGGKYIDTHIWNTKHLLYDEEVRKNGDKHNVRVFEGWEAERSKVLGNACLEIYRKHRKMGKLSDLSAEQYFSKCSNVPDFIEDKGKLRRQIKWDINADMWMSKTFPISISELVPVLEALSVKSSLEHGNAELDEREKGIETLTQLLKTEGIAESGFPVRINLPIHFGIFAKVTFKRDCRLLNEGELCPSLFNVPSGYKYSKKLQQARLRDYGT